MDREFYSKLLQQICDATGLDFEYMAKLAARDVAPRGLEDELKSRLCPTV